MARDPVLEDRLRDALSGAGPLAWKAMMGGYCAMKDGHLLASANTQKGEALFMFRLGRAAAEQAVRDGAARPLQAGPRTMPGYVQVPAASCDAAALRRWVALALAEVARLPPKG